MAKIAIIMQIEIRQISQANIDLLREILQDVDGNAYIMYDGHHVHVTDRRSRVGFGRSDDIARDAYFACTRSNLIQDGESIRKSIDSIVEDLNNSPVFQDYYTPRMDYGEDRHMRQISPYVSH